MQRFTFAVLLTLGTLASADAADLGRVGEYRLNDTAGAAHTPADWQDAKAVVYVVLGTECPVSNGYAPHFQRLADKYAAKDVRLVGIYAEPTVSADEARQHGEEYGLKFVRLLDPAHELTTQSGAKTMPSVIVALPDGTIAYRGRVDDRWSPEGKRRDVPRTRELEDALEAVLSGKPPTVAETTPFGCPIPQVKSEIRNQKSDAGMLDAFATRAFQPLTSDFCLLTSNFPQGPIPRGLAERKSRGPRVV